MSYLHCPRCARAYHVERELGCPHCGARAGAQADAADEIVAAAELLARAVERATPAQLADAQARIAGARALAAPPAPREIPQLAAPPAPPPRRSLRHTLALATQAMLVFAGDQLARRLRTR